MRTFLHLFGCYHLSQAIISHAAVEVLSNGDVLLNDFSNYDFTGTDQGISLEDAWNDKEPVSEEHEDELQEHQPVPHEQGTKQGRSLSREHDADAGDDTQSQNSDVQSYVDTSSHVDTSAPANETTYTPEIKKNFCHDLLYLLVEKQTDERRMAKGIKVKTPVGELLEKQREWDEDPYDRQINYHNTTQSMHHGDDDQYYDSTMESMQKFNESVGYISRTMNLFPHLFDKHSPFFMIGLQKTSMGRDAEELLGPNFYKGQQESWQNDDSEGLGEAGDKIPQSEIPRSLLQLGEVERLQFHEGERLTDFGVRQQDSKTAYGDDESSLQVFKASLLEKVAKDAMSTGTKTHSSDDFKKWFLDANPGATSTPWDMEASTEEKSKAMHYLLTVARTVLNSNIGTLEKHYTNLCPDQDKKEDTFLEQCNAKNKESYLKGAASKEEKDDYIFDQGLQTYKRMVGKNSDDEKYDQKSPTPETAFVQRMAVWKIGAFYDDAKYLYRGTELKKKSIGMEDDQNTLVQNYCGNADVVEGLSNLEKVKDSVLHPKDGLHPFHNETMDNLLNSVFQKRANGTVNFETALAEWEELEQQATGGQADFPEQIPPSAVQSFLEISNKQESASEKELNTDTLMDAATVGLDSEISELTREMSTNSDALSKMMNTTLDDTNLTTLVQSEGTTKALSSSTIGERRAEASIQELLKNGAKTYEKGGKTWVVDKGGKTKRWYWPWLNSKTAGQDLSPTHKNPKYPGNGCNANYYIGRPLMLINWRGGAGCNAKEWRWRNLQCHARGWEAFSGAFTLDPNKKLISMGGLECYGTRNENVRCMMEKGRGNIVVQCHQNHKFGYKLRNKDDYKYVCSNYNSHVPCFVPWYGNFERFQLEPLDEAWQSNFFQNKARSDTKQVRAKASSAIAEADRAEDIIKRGQVNWDRAADAVLSATTGYHHHFLAWDDAYKWAKKWHDTKVFGDKEPLDVMKKMWIWAYQAKKAHDFLYGRQFGFNHRWQAWDAAFYYTRFVYNYLKSRGANGNQRLEEIDEAWQNARKALMKGQDWITHKADIHKAVRVLKESANNNEKMMKNLENFIHGEPKKMKDTVLKNTKAIDSQLATASKEIVTDIKSQTHLTQDSANDHIKKLKADLEAADTQYTGKASDAKRHMDEVRTRDAQYAGKLHKLGQDIGNNLRSLERNIMRENSKIRHSIDNAQLKSAITHNFLNTISHGITKLHDDSAVENQKSDAKIKTRAMVLEHKVKAAGLSTQENKRRADQADALIKENTQKQKDALAAAVEEKDAKLAAAEAAFTTAVMNKDKEIETKQAQLRRSMSDENKMLTDHMSGPIKSRDDQIQNGISKKIDIHDEHFRKALDFLVNKVAMAKSGAELRDLGLGEKQAYLDSYLTHILDTATKDLTKQYSNMESRLNHVDTAFRAHVGSTRNNLQGKDDSLAATERRLLTQQKFLESGLNTAKSHLQKEITGFASKNAQLHNNLQNTLGKRMKEFDAKVDVFDKNEVSMKEDLKKINTKVRQAKKRMESELMSTEGMIARAVKKTKTEAHLRDTGTNKALTSVRKDNKASNEAVQEDIKKREEALQGGIREKTAAALAKIEAEGTAMTKEKAAETAALRLLLDNLDGKSNELNGGVTNLVANLRKEKQHNAGEMGKIRDYERNMEREATDSMQGGARNMEGKMKTKQEQLMHLLQQITVASNKIKADQQAKAELIEKARKEGNHDLVARLQAVDSELNQEERRRAAELETMRVKARELIMSIQDEMNKDDRNIKAGLSDVGNYARTVEKELQTSAKTLTQEEGVRTQYIEHEAESGDQRIAADIDRAGGALGLEARTISHDMDKLNRDAEHSRANEKQELEHGWIRIEGKLVNVITGEEKADTQMEEEIANQKAAASDSETILNNLLKHMQSSNASKTQNLQTKLSAEEKAARDQYNQLMGITKKEEGALAVAVKHHNEDTSQGINKLNHDVKNMKVKLDGAVNGARNDTDTWRKDLQHKINEDGFLMGGQIKQVDGAISESASKWEAEMAALLDHTEQANSKLDKNIHTAGATHVNDIHGLSDYAAGKSAHEHNVIERVASQLSEGDETLFTNFQAMNTDVYAQKKAAEDALLKVTDEAGQEQIKELDDELMKSKAARKAEEAKQKANEPKQKATGANTLTLLEQYAETGEDAEGSFDGSDAADGSDVSVARLDAESQEQDEDSKNELQDSENLQKDLDNDLRQSLMKELEKVEPISLLQRSRVLRRES